LSSQYRGLSSSTSTLTFNRTRTSLNTDDYVAQSNEYYFEIVAQNNNATNGYNVSLVDSSNNAISDSLILVPANTTALTRFRVDFTPSNGSNNYRVRINATAVADQVVVHSAKIIVNQYRATQTKLYIPLTSGNFNGDTNVDTNAAAIASITSASYQPLGTVTTSTTLTGVAHYWQKVVANYDAISTASDAWTLESVISSSGTNRTASLGLFNRTLATPAVVTGAETSTTATAPTMMQASFANNATNFTDTNNFEVRLKSTHNTQGTGYVYKAGLWVKLKFLKRAEIYHRLATRRYASPASSVLIPDGRVYWEPSNWTNPTVYLEANGLNPAGTTANITLQDHGASDSATTLSTVSGSTITPTTTYGRARTGALSLTNLSRYSIYHTNTAGTPYLGGAFLIIRTQE